MDDVERRKILAQDKARTASLRTASIIASRLGLTPTDRHEIATMTFGRDVRTWADLSHREAAEMMRAFLAFPWILARVKQNRDIRKHGTEPT